MRTFFNRFRPFLVSCFLLVHENQNIEIDRDILPSVCFIFSVACSDWGHGKSICRKILFDIWGERPIPWCCDEKIVLTRADVIIYPIEFKCKRKNPWKKKKEKEDKAFRYLERKILNIETPWNWNYRDKFHPCLTYRSHETFWSQENCTTQDLIVTRDTLRDLSRQNTEKLPFYKNLGSITFLFH